MKATSATISRTHKLLFAAAAGLLFAVLLELGCRIVRPPVPLSVFRAEVRDGSTVAVFTLNEHQSSCVIPKPPQVYRVLVFGESAANGAPYVPGGGFPAWLAAMIKASGPAVKVEVVNLGVNGINSTGISAWFDQALELDPDLVIFYLGNNESGTFNRINRLDHPHIDAAIKFLSRHSGFYQMVDAAFNANKWLVMPVGFYFLEWQLKQTREPEPDRLRQRIDALYRENLSDMASAARAKNVPVAILSPAANLRGWPPANSVHGRDMDASATADFDDVLKRGRLALAAKDYVRAQSDFSQAVKLDPHFAEAEFELGMALLAQDRPAEALPHLQNARELEFPHFRAPYRFIAITREVAKQTGAVWIDLDSELNRADPQGAAGWDFFFDSVHFKDPGNHRTAAAIINRLAPAGMLPVGPKTVPGYDELLPEIPVKKQVRESAEVNMGLFIGFFFNRPELSREAIRDFARSTEPADRVFSLIARAALHARLGETPEAAQALTKLRTENPRALPIAAARFFPGLLEIYQDQAVFGIFPDTSLAGPGFEYIRYRQNAHPPPVAAGEFGKIPLPSASICLVYDQDRKEFVDVTEGVRKILESASGGRPETSLLKPMLVASSNRMEFDWDQKTFRAGSDDSYFVIYPLPADPLELPVLEITAAIRTPSPGGENFASIYWAGPGPLKFSEERKIAFSWPADGKIHTRLIPLGTIARLLMDRPITALRFDFTSAPAELRIEKLSMEPEKK